MLVWVFCWWASLSIWLLWKQKLRQSWERKGRILEWCSWKIKLQGAGLGRLGFQKAMQIFYLWKDNCVTSRSPVTYLSSSWPHTPMNWRQWEHRLAQLRAVVCACSVASVMSDSAMPWTAVHQAPLSMGFSRQEYWSGLALPSAGDPPDPGIEPTSLNVSCNGRQILYHQRHLGRPAQLRPAQTADPPNRDLKKWLLI